MGDALKIVVILVVVGILLVPIFPSQSCSPTTNSVDIFGHQIASKTTTTCSTENISLLQIFLKGLKNT